MSAKVGDKFIFPTHDLLLVQVHTADEVTPGGIIRPKQFLDKENRGAQQGTVLSVGPEVREKCRTHPIVEGAVVFFERYAGVELKEGDEYYRILAEADVLAVVR